MTKPKFTPDPPPVGATDAEVIAWGKRQLDRIEDWWPKDLEDRLAALELRFPYKPGTWPIVDSTEVDFNSYQIRSTFPYNAYFKKTPLEGTARIGDFNVSTGGIDWFENVDWDGPDQASGFNPPDYDADGNLLNLSSYQGSTKQVQAIVSTDGGRSWSQRGQVLNLEAELGHKVYFNPADQTWYAFGYESTPPTTETEGKVFTSNDFGVTWTQVWSGNPSNPSIGLFASSTGDMVFRDNNYWVWQWSEQGSGTYFFLISTDQGRTWPTKAVIDTTGTYPVERRIETRSCMCYDEVNNYWYMGTRPLSGSNYGGIIRQPGPNISGGGWSLVYLDAGTRQGIAAWEGNVLMTGVGGVVYSEDGGSTWNVFGSEIRGDNYSLSVSTNGGILFGGENSAGPFRYTGSGNFIDEGAIANWPDGDNDNDVRVVMMIDPDAKR